MKKIIIICIYFFLKLIFSQNEYSYYPKPNEHKVSEIKYKYDDGQVYKKEKFFYNKKWNLEKVKTLTPFDFLKITKKYYYDKDGKINHVSYLNKFNYVYQKDEYKYFIDKYIVKRFKINKLEEVSTFDTLDRKIGNQTFFRNKLSYTYKYTYKGNNKKYSEYFRYNSDNELEEKQTIEYNKNKEEVKIIIEKTNELTINGVTTYNNQNKILENLRIDTNGRIIRRSTFEYTKNSKIRISRAEDDVLSDKRVWLYDKNKQLISDTTYRTGILGEKFKVDYKINYFYDSNRCLLSTSTYNTYTGKLLLGRKDFYNKDRQVVKKEKYYLDELSSVSEMRNGLEILYKGYSEGKITKITNFQYDKKGNLILISEKHTDRNTVQKTKVSYDKTGKKTYTNL